MPLLGSAGIRYCLAATTKAFSLVPAGIWSNNTCQSQRLQSGHVTLISPVSSTGAGAPIGESHYLRPNYTATDLVVKAVATINTACTCNPGL